MILFLIIGILELIIVVFVYSVFQNIYFALTKKNYKIDAETTILIVGGASWIGKSLALQFAQKHHCKIIILDEISNQQSLLDEISATGSTGNYYQMKKLCDEEEIKTTINVIFSKHKSIDILINATGASSYKLFTELSFEEIEKTFEVNFLVPVSIIKKVLEQMLKQNRGHIVNISSLACLMPSFKMTDYCAGKAALTGFHSALRLELKHEKKNILTTLVCTQNQIFGEQAESLQQNSNWAKQIYNYILEQREEVFIPTNWMQGALLMRALPTAVIDYLSKPPKPQYIQASKTE